MILGLLNLKGSLSSLVLSHLQSSGLLDVTTSLYSTSLLPPHPRSARVPNELSLYAIVRNYPHALVWSIDTSSFASSSIPHRDHCLLQCFFLLTHWRRALEVLSQGYDGYGVNLFVAPTLHYSSNCFWMRGSSMTTLLSNPYHAYCTFVDHETTAYPTSHYQTYDHTQPALLSSRSHRSKLEQLPSTSLRSLLFLLFMEQYRFEFVPFHRLSRPSILLDTDRLEALAVCVPGVGRIECRSPSLLERYRSLGWVSDIVLLSSPHKYDLIVTTASQVESWLPHLYQTGHLVTLDVYSGPRPSTTIGSHSIVAHHVSSLP